MALGSVIFLRDMLNLTYSFLIRSYAFAPLHSTPKRHDSVKCAHWDYDRASQLISQLPITICQGSTGNKAKSGGMQDS